MKLLKIFFLLSVVAQTPKLYSMTDVNAGDTKAGLIAGTVVADGKNAVIAEELKLPAQDIYVDHIKLRYFMGGDEKQYCALFKKAVEANNAVLQVALANAYFAAVKDNDAKKDFSKFDAKQFKIFPYTRQRGTVDSRISSYYLYEELYVKTFGVKVAIETSIEVYEAAAKEGFVPALLFQVVNPIWINRVNDIEDKYNLQKLAATGYPEAIFEFGRILFMKGNESEKAQGLKYMYDSGFLKLEYPDAGEIGENYENIGFFWDRHTRKDGNARVFYEPLVVIIEKYVVLVPYHGDFEKACAGAREPLSSKL